MMTPSPLRQPHIYSKDTPDLFLNSPYQTPPAQAPLSSLSSKPQPIGVDDEDGFIFLSASATPGFAPLFTSSSSPTLLTPVKPERYGVPARVALGERSINESHSASPSSNESTSSRSARIGTKRKSTPACTPLRIDTSTSFQKLAPLPAPKLKSATRTPQSRAEAEAFLLKQTSSLTRLKLSDRMDTSLDDDDSDCEFDQEGGISLFKAVLQSGKGKATEEVAEAVSPGGHISKRRAKSRPVSAELRIQQALRSMSPVKKPLSFSRPRQTNMISFPSSAHRGRSSPGSSSSEAGSPLPRRRINGASRPYIKPPAFASRPPLSRQDNLSAATLFFGPAIPNTLNLFPPSTSNTVGRSRAATENTTIIGSDHAVRSKRSSTSANRHSYAGTGTSGDWAHIPTTVNSTAPTSPLRTWNDTTYSSSDEDEAMSFDPPANSTFDITDNTPQKLARKYEFVKANDSAVIDLDTINSLRVMHPGATTSVSSLGSDDGLITPAIGPSAQSGWPFPKVQGYSSDDQKPRHTDDEADVDDFIVRTLATAAKGPAPGSKRPPGTPVKKVRTAFLADRPWQSCVASKIGLKDEQEPRKVPRKSLPSAFPISGARAVHLLEQTDETDEEDSPSAKKDMKYQDRVGLGHPQSLFGPNALSNPRTRWLMRRSSSGAFSSGSENSQNNTPTRPNKTIDWQLPKLSTNLSPTARLSKPADRSASGSSTSTVMGESPSNRKIQSARARIPTVRRRKSESFIDDHSGRFERDFETVDELGSGEFGSVIKARSKKADDSEELYAIKRSKRFEGAKHRLRLWEEVEVLKHLSGAAVRNGFDCGHPNVLAYIDSWEENEALFIQTELCESGNLAHFLWEYGKVYPRLDEARVWKSVVDLVNGLCFIHESGVIHLDLKPSNVFVTHEGRFKIGDFGMASLWPRRTGRETDGSDSAPSFEREGDKLYLAPEVLQGRYSKAADVFSFGMTILEAATNIVVPDQGEAWHRLRQEDFSQVEWEGSNELLSLIRGMMATNPEERICARDVYNHPVVAQARRKMEMAYEEAKGNGTNVFAASPLARVPRGFLEEILGMDDREMDVSG